MYDSPVPLNQDTMTQRDEQIKAFSVRWPESFWERAKIAALQRRISLQEAVTLGCAAYLDIEPPEKVDGDVVEEPSAPPQKKRRAS